MIEVKIVKTKKEQREFLEFPLKLYKNNPYFVPPLYSDEAKIFKSNYVYYDQSIAEYWNAYRDGIMVGRISAILQYASNAKWKQKRVRFTRFDSLDDIEVAKALFSTIEEWARTYGMEEVVGPLGFSDLEREGLLIEGFDELSTFEEQYNYPYYQKLIESCGYGKDVDWVERKVYVPKENTDRLKRMSNLMLHKNHLKLIKCKSTNDFLKRYANQFFDILDITYNHIYGTVPFTEKMKKMMVSNFKLIINVKYVGIIVDENDKVVCFGICFPSIGKALQKSSGHLSLPAIFRLLRSLRHPKILDLGLIGVLPEYEGKGVSTAFLAGIQETLTREKIEYAETNLNLEDNLHIQNQWKEFDAIIHKRRRSFVKNIIENEKNS